MKTNCSLTQEEIDEVEKRFKHLRIKFIIYAVLKPALIDCCIKIYLFTRSPFRWYLANDMFNDRKYYDQPFYIRI